MEFLVSLSSIAMETKHIWSSSDTCHLYKRNKKIHISFICKTIDISTDLLCNNIQGRKLSIFNGLSLPCKEEFFSIIFIQFICFFSILNNTLFKLLPKRG